MHKGSSVFQRFILSYVLLLISSVLMISGIAYYKTYSIVYRNIQTTNLASVERLEERVQSVLSDTDSISWSLQGWPAINKIFTMSGDLDSSWVSNDELFNLVYVLRKHKALHSYIDNIAIVFRDVDLVIDCNSASTTRDNFFGYRFSFESEEFSGLEDLDFAWDRKLVTDCMVGKYTQPNQRRILYFRAIPNAAGSNKAMLLVTINPGLLAQLLGETMVFDEEMWLITDDEKNPVLSGNSFSEETVLSLPAPQEKGSRTGYVPLKGELCAYYYLYSPALEQHFYAFYPLNNIIGQFLAIIPFMILSLIAVFGIGLLIAFHYARKNYAPIRKLVDLSPPFAPEQPPEDEFSLIEGSLRNLTSENDGLRQRLDAYMPVVRNNLMNRLLLSTGLTEADRQELAGCSIVFPESHFFVCVISIDAMDLHSEKTLAESPVSGVLFISYIEEYFKDKQMIFYPAEMYSGNYTLLMNCSPAQAGNVRRLLDGLVPFLRRSFPSDLDIDLRMGISPVKENPVNFKQLYYQALHAAEYQFPSAPGAGGSTAAPQVVWFDDLNQKRKISYNFTFNDELKLMNLIKSGQKEEALSFADSILDDFFSQGRIRREDAFYIFNQLLFLCAKVIHETQTRVSDVVDFQKLLSLPLFTQMNEYTMSCISATCDIIRNQRSSAENNLSERIVQYIRENSANCDLDLTSLADHFHVTAIYVSKAVRKVSGLSFIDYLNRLRTDEAKTLLSTTERSVRDIAADVGYDSDKNFIRVFKKYEGVTPGQYRKASKSGSS